MQPIIPYFQTVIFRIPLPPWFSDQPIEIYAFGVFVAIGINAGLAYAIYRGTLKENLNSSVVVATFLIAATCVVYGGHLGYAALYRPEQYLDEPFDLLDIRRGHSSLGGLAIGLLSIGVLLRCWKQPILPHFDNLSASYCLGAFFGRLGCFANHEHLGSVSNFLLARYCRPVEGFTLALPGWMVQEVGDHRFGHCYSTGTLVPTINDSVSTDYAGVIAVHDTALYEALFLALLFCLLLWLGRRRRPAGFFIAVVLIAYAPFRFALEFLRPIDVHNPRILGLTPAQIICVGLASVVIGIMIARRSRLRSAPALEARGRPAVLPP